MATRMLSRPMSSKPIETKLEVVIIPVADVDRAKKFYLGLGWRLDGDFVAGDWRAVQVTPPGSPCSVIFGKGVTSAAPGSVQGNFLVVADAKAARADLIERGVRATEVFHFDGPLHVTGTYGRVPGREPEGKSYFTWVGFEDPDGNSWLMQEITTRLPGRGLSNLDVATLTAFLREAEEHHGDFEKKAPKHHWSDWYSAYIVARQQGRLPADAVKDAAAHMAGILG
jgi:catechol 2,3-dioxygenase-like lactoylglutathione lyase family enzyme